MLTQIFIFLLAFIAAIVAYGMYKRKDVWHWILLYWLVLTAKNMLDLLKCS